MSPVAAVTQLLGSALEPAQVALEEIGITCTIDATTDKLTGDVLCSYQFRVKRATAEKLASRDV